MSAVQLTYNNQKFYLPKKRVVIFCGVSFFAIQLLVLIFLYGDIWVWEVGLGLPLTYSYFTTDNYPYELIFKESDSHIHIFSRIPLLLSFFFDNFDTKTVMYFGWALFSASIYFLYLILKRTNEKLTWLLIPLSAFVYNPIQHYTILSGFIIFAYGLPVLATIAIAYFLNKKNIGRKSYFAALTMGIVSSFSIIQGTLALISGLFPLIHRKEKKKLFGWILTLSSVLITYVFVWSHPITEKIIVAPNKQLLVFLKLIALPYVVKVDILYTIVALSMIILFIFSFVFLRKYYKLNILLPWIQIGFVGLFASMTIAIGRAGVSYYYSTLTSLFAMCLIVFLGLILTVWTLPLQKKTKILKIIFIIALATQLVLLIPTYYMGWKLAKDLNEYETSKKSCYSLTPDYQSCNDISDGMKNPTNFEYLQIFNELMKQKKGIFLHNSLNKKALDDQKFYEETLEKITNSSMGYGKIEEINGNINPKSVMIRDPMIVLSGWILDENKKPVDYMYILSNNKPLTKITHFDLMQNNIKLDDGYETNSKWKISFLSGYLENECSKISIIGFKENKKIIIDEHITICKN